jgi:outer membrane protein assembly factor BamB
MQWKRLLAAVCVLAAFAMALWANDWPQWRGPNRNGISQEKGLLKQWPEGGPKLLWQVKGIGEGYSTPAVVGGRMYLLANKGMDDEFALALDAFSGAQAWSTRLGNVGPNDGPQYPGSRSTPTVDGKLLYALGSDGDLACLEAASGAMKWQKNLRKDFGGIPGKWAYSESPLVDGETLICTPGGAEATLVALNKATGEVIWKSAVPGADQASYASVIVVEVNGVKQYVQFLQKGLVGVEAKTGKLLWRYDKTAQGSLANIPTPVARKAFVFSASGKGGGGLVELKNDAGSLSAEEIYATAKVPTSIGGAIEIDGYLYGTNTAGLMCVDFATGDLKWQERGVGAGSVFYADGRLYVHGEKGEVALVEATPEAYRELGRFSPPDQPEKGKSQAWTYPVVANGRLYLRDMGVVWCYDVAAGK